MFAAVEPRFGTAAANAGFSEAVNTDYTDRSVPPEITVARMRSFFGALGITRLANQTGLDRLAIPCFAAFRPNARSLSVNQGKGLTLGAAMASAVMEATEFAIAESPQVETIRASSSEMCRSDRKAAALQTLLPKGYEIGIEQPITWARGHLLNDRTDIWVPLDSFRIDATRCGELPWSRTTNGLASGNNEHEALFHGLCELIERDAASLFAMRSPDDRQRQCTDSAAFADPVIDALDERITRVGCELRLYHMPSNIGVPSFMALIRGGHPHSDRHFSLTAGYGCHPVPARAALRAITEAAQSRITNIAGSRDDFSPEDYDRPLAEELESFAHGNAVPRAVTGDVVTGDLTELLDHVLDELRRCGIGDIIAVPLGGEEMGISVIKLFAEGLEDRAPNHNWRPGKRAIAAAMGLI